MSVAVDFRQVDIVFGNDPAASLAMIDAGATRLGLSASKAILEGLDAEPASAADSTPASGY